MCGDGDPALVVDALQRFGKGPQRRYSLMNEEREHMPAPGGDLLANHQLERVGAGVMQLAGAERAVDPLVIGDGHDVEIGVLLDVIQHRLDRCGPIRVQGVEVHVGLAELSAGARHEGMSGQYGWKAPHHCSGFSPIWRSKMAPMRSASEAMSARRSPVSGTSTISPSIRKRSGPIRRQRPTTRLARCMTTRVAGPRGMDVSCPNILTG